MELYAEGKARRANDLRGEIEPSEWPLVSVAIDAGIQLEQIDPIDVDRTAEVLLTQARWSDESAVQHTMLNASEVTWAMQGLGYLSRGVGARALDTILRNSASLPFVGDTLAEATPPDIGTPVSPQLRREARTTHRHAMRSLVDAQTAYLFDDKL